MAHAIPGNGVADSLAVLERKGLVVVRPMSTLSGQEEFAFRHALVRDVAYSSLPKARRARAHAEAGDWISELAGQRSDEFVELVAYHYETAIAGEDADLAWLADAGEREAVRAKAHDSLLAAGNVARRQYALDRAVELHERALALATDDRERVDAYEQIGRDHDLAFHGELALAAYRSAIDLAREDPAQAARLARLARRAGTLIAVRGGSFEMTPDHTEIDGLIREGLDVVGDRRERAALLMACAEMALRWSITGRPDPLGMDRRMAAAEEAKLIAGELDDARLGFEAADILGDLKLVSGDYAGATQEVIGALPLLDRIDAPSAKAPALFEAAQAVLLEGDPARALELADQSSQLARHMSAHDQMHATSVIMTAADWLGDWDRVEAALAEHLANFDEEANVHCLNVQSGPNRGGLVVAHRGDHARARAIAVRAMPFEPTPGTIQSTAADVLVAVGDAPAGLNTARDVMERGPDGASQRPPSWRSTPWKRSKTGRPLAAGRRPGRPALDGPVPRRACGSGPWPKPGGRGDHRRRYRCTAAVDRDVRWHPGRFRGGADAGGAGRRRAGRARRAARRRPGHLRASGRRPARRAGPQQAGGPISGLCRIGRPVPRSAAACDFRTSRSTSSSSRTCRSRSMSSRSATGPMTQDLVADGSPFAGRFVDLDDHRWRRGGRGRSRPPRAERVGTIVEVRRAEHFADGRWALLVVGRRASAR